MPLGGLSKTAGTASFVPSSGKQNAAAIMYPWVQIKRLMLRQDGEFSSEVAFCWKTKKTKLIHLS